MDSSTCFCDVYAGDMNLANPVGVNDVQIVVKSLFPLDIYIYNSKSRRMEKRWQQQTTPRGVSLEEGSGGSGQFSGCRWFRFWVVSGEGPRRGRAGFREGIPGDFQRL